MRSKSNSIIVPTSGSLVARLVVDSLFVASFNKAESPRPKACFLIALAIILLFTDDFFSQT